MGGGCQAVAKIHLGDENEYFEDTVEAHITSLCTFDSHFPYLNSLRNLLYQDPGGSLLCDSLSPMQNQMGT